MTPELSILILNIVILAMAYLVVYPKTVGGNLNKLLVNDIIASLTALLVAGSVFWGSDYQFNLIVTNLNWFWFTLLTYAVLEIPLMLWYLKKYNISLH